MSDLELRAEDPSSEDVRALLDRHLRFTRDHSPAEECYALDETALDAENVSLFGLRDGSELLAIGALKRIESFHLELKSMHTAESARERGVGRAMLRQLVAWADSNGYARISLETGSNAAFTPARLLYESAGFRTCEPFGDPVTGANSVHMTLEL
ncbi:putative acetyltransferase [Actinopolyspora mzabensis]|uniref:Putative acetyltransferase n=1 Tax=Actinopolyspora mzabensis TaxID=995066 RepID=A0A1G8Y0K9_ACTMZ|nr:GNAT family N-acetyltransferase [Actinopolyspora mzabensis]SDJ96301.1 putative acetyltransferase [Actinopolyspora mzabensis]